MDRILRAGPDWERAVAEAVAGASHPIPLDDRLQPRGPDGQTTRRRFDRASLPAAREASTLLAIYPGADGGLVIPLTVRHSDLRAHAGEVSLPGGAVDAADASREATALREAWEEIGLEPSLPHVVGHLDDVWIPVSNFELRPFVATIPTRPQLVPHDREVAAIVELPLASLFDPAAIGTEEFSGRGFTVRAGAYRHGDVLVWGATALTLGMLAHVLTAAADIG